MGTRQANRNQSRGKGLNGDISKPHSIIHVTFYSHSSVVSIGCLTPFLCEAGILKEHPTLFRQSSAVVFNLN